MAFQPVFTDASCVVYTAGFSEIGEMFMCKFMHVQVVVGTTFDDVVNDATKDVIIFFHSSWCEECPGVSKKLQKVAKKVDNYCQHQLSLIM